jgi:hypothetical protein
LPQPDSTQPIYVEQGAEALATQIANHLSDVRTRIESTHGALLSRLPPIVVCATDACYQRYAASRGSSGETLWDRRISINGALIAKYNKDPVMIFTHELSHFFWYERGVVLQPHWFEEGLAVWVSGGGGAETLSENKAEAAISAGLRLHPTLDSGLWAYLSTPSEQGLGGVMFYRQSGMFIQYLHDKDPDAFGRLLEALRRDRDLKQAWRDTYPDDVNVSWDRYVNSILNRQSHPEHGSER